MCVKENPSAIRGKFFQKSEEGPLETDSTQVTDDIENTFCQSCTNFKTQIDYLWTKKDELVKT